MTPFEIVVMILIALIFVAVCALAVICYKTNKTIMMLTYHNAIPGVVNEENMIGAAGHDPPIDPVEDLAYRIIETMDPMRTPKRSRPFGAEMFVRRRRQ